MLQLNKWYKWKDSSKSGELCFIDPGKTFVTLHNPKLKEQYWNISYYTFIVDWEKIPEKVA